MILSTRYRTLGFERPNDSSLLDMYGQELMQMFADGHKPAFNASGQKSSAILLPLFPISPPQMYDSTIFISILLDHSLHRRATPTCSHVLIDLHDGQRPSPSAPALRTSSRKRLSVIGSLDLARPPQSPLTGDDSSSPPCGLNSRSYLDRNESTRQPIIPCLMV